MSTDWAGMAAAHFHDAGHFRDLGGASTLALRLVLAWLDGNFDGMHAAVDDLPGDRVGADCVYCLGVLTAALVGIAVRGFDELARAEADNPEFPGAAAFVAGLLARQLDTPGGAFPTWAPGVDE